MQTLTKAATGEEIDEAFEAGEDMRKYFDLSTARVVEPDISDRRINLNMPEWLVEAIDLEAAKSGANRQSYINMTMRRAVEEARGKRIA